MWLDIAIIAFAIIVIGIFYYPRIKDLIEIIIDHIIG